MIFVINLLTLLFGHSQICVISDKMQSMESVFSQNISNSQYSKLCFQNRWRLLNIWFQILNFNLRINLKSLKIHTSPLVSFHFIKLKMLNKLPNFWMFFLLKEMQKQMKLINFCLIKFCKRMITFLLKIRLFCKKLKLRLKIFRNL